MLSAELISNQYIFRHKCELLDLIAVIHTIFNSNDICCDRGQEAISNFQIQ